MCITPGPNNIMSMNNARNVGLRKAVRFNFGIFAGFFTVMILCMLFSTVLFNVVPKIQFPMKIAGAVYLAYLIVKTLLPHKDSEIKDSGGGFLTGAVLQVINPKGILFGITTASSFILPHYHDKAILLLFAFGMALTALLSTLCWAVFGSLFSLVFSRHGKILNIVMAALLLYCAVSLFR
jgi:threonine/homoserine/homoserine lactone efflux protein